ncbi:hypothetical protein OUZ56_014013 [Daphnia magna]|uniref:Uncharacterized protein n=1 Tax=Daphnia magna TaxID=35525 RepID=A0ABQ9Z7N6_9CRUS|nr:hypothetical protein OUZ56_014013 [Daphnia magna]
MEKEMKMIVNDTGAPLRKSKKKYAEEAHTHTRQDTDNKRVSLNVLIIKTKQEQKHSVQTRFSKLREVRHDLVLTKHGSAPENIRHRPKRS